MKKLFLLTLLALVSISVSAQEVVGHYTSAYFKKDFEIMAYNKDSELKLYIQVMGEREHHNVVLIIDGENSINSFISSLTSIRDKYAEWSKVAKDNNVGKYSKNFDITFNKFKVAWYYGSEWEFDYYEKPTPKFMITEDGDVLMVVYSEATASDNEYITEEYYFVLASINEFNELIDKIQPSVLKSKLEEKAVPDELFK